MSEKIYALLVRLYPSHFREAYGEAALQLFRDRARDEKGFFSRVRLWFDLLTDLAISVPREYHHIHADARSSFRAVPYGRRAFTIRSGRRVAASRRAVSWRHADIACPLRVLAQNCLCWSTCRRILPLAVAGPAELQSGTSGSR